MGRKQNRKRSRRQRARADVIDFGLPPAPWETLDLVESVETDEAIMALFSGRSGAATARTCGTCREFVEDGEFGRGTCLHPGSGIFAPWDNTPACEFYAGRRR
jgi:hypothetical protein